MSPMLRFARLHVPFVSRLAWWLLIFWRSLLCLLLGHDDERQYIHPELLDREGRGAGKFQHAIRDEKDQHRFYYSTCRRCNSLVTTLGRS